jgi:hypothetical protein
MGRSSSGKAKFCASISRLPEATCNLLEMRERACNWRGLEAPLSKSGLIKAASLKDEAPLEG